MRTLRDSATKLATTYDVVVVTDRDEALVREDFADARRELDRLEAILSEWQPDSALSRLNREGARGAVAVPAELLAILRASVNVSRATGGAFDVTWFAFAPLWNAAAKTQVIPTPEQLATAQRSVGPQAMVFEGDRVRLAPGTQIGLGGVAKGWIVDAVYRLLRERGYTDLLVNIGGDLRAAGGGPDGSHTLRIMDPFRPDRPVVELEVGDKAVATSGNAYRSVLIGDLRYGHLIDPRSGRPAPFEGSVTVLAANAAMADALATALFVLGPDEGLALAKRTPGLDVVYVSRSEIRSTLPGISQPRK